MPLEAKKKYFFFAFRDQMGPNKKQGLNKVSRKLKKK